MFNSIIAALAALAVNAAASIGASLAHGFSALAAGFLPEERDILVKVKAKFYEAYNAAITDDPGSQIDAIEKGATAALNEFCSDEKAFMAQEARAVITLLVSSLKSAAGLKAA